MDIDKEWKRVSLRRRTWFSFAFLSHLFLQRQLHRGGSSRSEINFTWLQITKRITPEFLSVPVFWANYYSLATTLSGPLI